MDLQERTGVGPGDLRTCLAELETEGVVEPTDGGWALSEGALDGVIGQPTDWTEPEDAQDGQEQPVEASEAPTEVHTLPPALEGAGGPIRARIVMDVMFFTTPGEEPVEEAQAMRHTALERMSAIYPDLQVSATLESVDVFNAPRRIYPADGE